jgi:hypothetical protein
MISSLSAQTINHRRQPLRKSIKGYFDVPMVSQNGTELSSSRQARDDADRINNPNDNPAIECPVFLEDMKGRQPHSTWYISKLIIIISISYLL